MSDDVTAIEEKDQRIAELEEELRKAWSARDKSERRCSEALSEMADVRMALEKEEERTRQLYSALGAIWHVANVFVHEENGEDAK